jgi:hypothetical protein
MATVSFTYLGPGPVSVEIPSSVSVRSSDGALFFWPDFTKEITAEELAYMQGQALGSSYREVTSRSVQGSTRVTADV